MVKRGVKRIHEWLLGVGVTLVIIAMIQMGFLSLFDNALFDYYQQNYRKDASPNPNIKVILIDDHSVSLYGRYLGRWPWPREVYKDIIEFINLGNPKAIYFDMLFSEEEEDPLSHRQFLEAMKRAKNVHLGMIFYEEKESDFIKLVLPYRLNLYFGLKIENVDWLELRDYPNFSTPLKSLLNVTKSLPVYTMHPDSDGKYRRVPLLFRFGYNIFPSLTLSAVQAFQENPKMSVYTDNSFSVGEYHFPLDKSGKILLNWYPKGFESYSISGILASWQQIDEGENRENLLIDPKEFEDAIVIIGTSAMGLHDLKSTPINRELPGPEIHATFISNILNDEVIAEMEEIYQILSVILLIIITLVALIWLDKSWKYLIPIVACFIYCSASVWLFIEKFYFFPVGSAVIGVFVCYLVVIAYSNIHEIQERSKLEVAFSKYFSPSVLETVLKDMDTYAPEEGKKTDATVLFCNIQKFTEITEKYPVDDIMSFLSNYFDNMIKEVHRSDGTVLKIFGNMIMAFWNSPIKVPDHPLRAVQSALRMQTKLYILNENWRHNGFPSIDITIGINTGQMIIGNVGSKRRLEYTAIGDQVNLAGRLDELCPLYGSKIIIGEPTYREVKGSVSCRRLGSIPISEKESLNIYEPMAEDMKSFIKEWDIVYEAIEGGDKAQALVLINDFIEQYPNDKTALVFKGRLSKDEK